MFSIAVNIDIIDSINPISETTQVERRTQNQQTVSHRASAAVCPATGGTFCTHA